MFWFRKREKRPQNLPKGQRSVYEGLHNLLIRFSGEQWAILTQFSNQWASNKSREFKHIFRKDAKLRELFLECVAVQCVILFRTAVGSRYSDHADYITNGTIQELAIHFSKSIRQDYHSVRNQIVARVEALAKCKEFSVEESSDNFKESTLGMHAATVRALLNITPFSVESVMMATAENERILAILESKEYEKEIDRSAPSIVLSQL
jgi:hypothetical protein